MGVVGQSSQFASQGVVVPQLWYDRPNNLVYIADFAQQLIFASSTGATAEPELHQCAQTEKMW
jgi:hypothetical protein